MSTIDEKLERPRELGGKARRSYASLVAALGFRVEAPGLVSIQPMDRRSTWKRVGGGKWDSPGAEYEKVDA